MSWSRSSSGVTSAISGAGVNASAATGAVTFSVPANGIVQAMVTGGYVDLINAQAAIAGAKTFTGLLTAAGGAELGTTVAQLVGAYGVPGIAQRSGAAQTAVVGTASTAVAPFGYTTAAQADSIVTLVNELRAWAVAQGWIKGGA
ncbi:MAG: hypothetical protein ACYDAY_12045 [Candidatus Dormibacteria bacterium]